MPDITLAKFDVFRGWIKSRRIMGFEWESIEQCCVRENQDLDSFFKFFISTIDPDAEFDIDTWKAIVKSEMDNELKEKELRDIADVAMIIDTRVQDSDFRVPTNPESSWQLYRKHLEDSGWSQDSVMEIEISTIETLRRLSLNTTEKGPIKGLVVGHVQSGKTANMAALIAMAGDSGWNLFIVLSGTIENLRRQTQSRLHSDLNRPGSLEWVGLERLSPLALPGSRAQDLRFEQNSRRRYFTVCLKNITRLENLINWLLIDKNKYGQMKIMVIDDESDQAGVNTANINQEERTRINSLIVNLVHGKTCSGDDPGYRPIAMNYIGYTATPYANFLNESYVKSLYPKDFIRTLRPSNQYFGPKQIFGLDEDEDCDGLNIIRNVESGDLTIISEIYKENSKLLPDSFKKSVAWFLCAASSMRYQGYKKPITMLIHTSQKISHHSQLAELLEKWMNDNKSEILALCRELWEEESMILTVESFREQFPDYGRSDAELNSYPDFSDIEDGIKLLLSEQSNIYMDGQGQFIYHSGVHLCIDNYDNSGVNADGSHVRLVYPEQGRKYPSPAPAFIVIGGNTLSRGLTLEGLVSTYFLRASNQADSLMQMGRWFGYRRGYELYPRIWITEKCRDKFRFLTRLEQDLRNDIRRFMDAGVSPSDYGPRVLNSPKVSWLRITSKNKMQGAVTDEMDFSGSNSQTVVFDNDAEVLRKNIEVTEQFLNSVGNGRYINSKTALVWENIDFNIIEENLLKRFKFNRTGRVFNQIAAFCDWYRSCAEQIGFTGWNVVAAGVGETKPSQNEDAWDVPGGRIWKVNRSRQANSKHDSISIGVLRAPKDLLADVDEGRLSDTTKAGISKNLKEVNVDAVRKEADLGKTPQLIIYRIKKNSTARNAIPLKASQSNRKSKLRENLNAPEDIIGLSIWIPGTRIGTSYAKRLTVHIHREEIDLDSEVE